MPIDGQAITMVDVVSPTIAIAVNELVDWNSAIRPPSVPRIHTRRHTAVSARAQVRRRALSDRQS